MMGSAIGALFTAAAARVAPVAAAAWGKLVFFGGIALALLGVYAVIRKGGRDAERADTLETGLATIGKANTAAKSVDHSQQAIDHDPDNLDARRP